MTGQITWIPTGPTVVTHWRSGPDGEWVEVTDGDGYFDIPIVDGAIGYDVYVQAALPPSIRWNPIGDYSWILRPIRKSKQLIHKGRKPR